MEKERLVGADLVKYFWELELKRGKEGKRKEGAGRNVCVTYGVLTSFLTQVAMG